MFDGLFQISWKDVLVFPLSFWLVCIICVTYYVAVFPFVTLGQVYFIEKYHFSSTNANFITGLVYLISAFAAPAFGFIIDRVGRNVTFVLVAVVTTLISHVVLAFTLINPYFSIVLMGIGYSLLASALWPIVALIVPIHRQGTAFGLMQAVQNLGLAVISLLAGLIVDKDGYLWLEIFFVGWLILATIATVALWLNDSVGEGFLNMTPKQRKDYEMSKISTEPRSTRVSESGSGPGC
jgi:MFS family permease